MGCKPGVEQLAPVKGKVQFRGRPLQGGTIVFIPDASRGTHGSMAIADIEPDGSFTMMTNNVLGAVPGHHKVTVSWSQPQSPLPVKYRDPQQSGVTCEILANKTNTVELDLQ
jgi:hypothetical protein